MILKSRYKRKTNETELIDKFTIVLKIRALMSINERRKTKGTESSFK